MSSVLEVFLSHRDNQCCHCELPIPPESLCTLSPRGIVHISCFWPFSPINFSEDVHFAANLTDDNITETKEWISTWNQRFLWEESNIPAEFLSRVVQGQCTAHRRPLIEVFAYLETRVIELLAAFVCRNWYCVSRDNELWKRKYTLELRPVDTSGIADYRRKFVVKTLNSCWHCRRMKTVFEFKEESSLLHRPLCLDCSETNECMAAAERHLLLYFTPLTLQNLHLQRWRRKETVSDIVKKLLSHCEERRRTLLSLLPTAFQDEHLVRKYVTEFDFKKAILGLRDQQQLVMLKFCGDSERTKEETRQAFATFSVAMGSSW